MVKKKVLIEILSVLIILSLALSHMLSIFYYTDISGGGFRNFYATKKDSIDVMIYGSSHAACTVDNNLLWEKAGISSFTLSSGSQPLESTYYYMKESFKYQKPKVAFVETLQANNQSLNDDGTYQSDMGTLYRSDLGMKWSLTYAEMIRAQSKLYGLDTETQLDLLLKMPIIHARYKELTSSDYNNDFYFKRGYVGSRDCTPDIPPQLTNDRAELTSVASEYLQKIVELCKKNGVKLVLFCAPYPEKTEECARQNAVSDFAKLNDTEFIDFNRINQDVGVDFSTDIRDGNHLNDNGADKVTEYLMKYLKKNYDLVDHRGNSDYKLWDENSRYMHDRYDMYNLQSTDDINSYLKILGEIYTKYDVIISLSGNYNAQGDSAYAPSLSSVGINMDVYHQGGTVVIKQGEICYYPKSESEYEYRDKFGERNIAIVGMNTADKDDENAIADHIYVRDKDYSMMENGVNIVIYDPQIDRMVDCVGVDVYTGLKPERNDEEKELIQD